MVIAHTTKDGGDYEEETNEPQFWASRSKFIDRFLFELHKPFEFSSPSEEIETDNYQYVRTPNEHQTEAMYQRGSRQHRIYRKLQLDDRTNQAKMVSTWRDPRQRGKQVIVRIS